MAGRLFVVVGGAGLFGSALARALAADSSARVVVCDALGSAGAAKWAGLPDMLDDLWSPDALWANLERVWRDVAAVVSTADAGHAEGNADALFATAFHLPRRLWDFAAARQRPVLWAGTTQIYGSGPAGLDAKPETLAALRPATALGAAARAMEVFAARNAHGPDKPPAAHALRLSHLYGAGEAHKGGLASLPHRALQSVAAGQPVALWSSTDPGSADGGDRRDWTHVEDAAAAAAHLVLNPASGATDIGTGELVEASAVVRAAGRALGVVPAVGFARKPAGVSASGPAADLGALRRAGYSGGFRQIDPGIADLAAAMRA